MRSSVRLWRKTTAVVNRTRPLSHRRSCQLLLAECDCRNLLLTIVVPCGSCDILVFFSKVDEIELLMLYVVRRWLCAMIGMLIVGVCLLAVSILQGAPKKKFLRNFANFSKTTIKLSYEILRTFISNMSAYIGVLLL